MTEPTEQQTKQAAIVREVVANLTNTLPSSAVEDSDLISNHTTTQNKK